MPFLPSKRADTVRAALSLGAALLAFLELGCGAPPPPPLPPASELRFVADFNAPEDGAFSEMGGISAIVYDHERDVWLAASDAREDSRLYELSIDLEDGAFSRRAARHDSHHGRRRERVRAKT